MSTGIELLIKFILFLFVSSQSIRYIQGKPIAMYGYEYKKEKQPEFVRASYFIFYVLLSVVIAYRTLNGLSEGTL